MSGDPIFLFRETELLLAQRDAAHQECHVPGQGPHGLKPLAVLLRFTGRPAVNTVPVLAGGTGIPEMVKYLFNSSKVAEQPPRRAQATLAPTFIVLSKDVL